MDGRTDGRLIVGERRSFSLGTKFNDMQEFKGNYLL